MKCYKDLEIFNIAFQLALNVHKMTTLLPSFETLEQGRQVRKSSKSIYSNIAEGYGRKVYKADFMKYLIYAHASCDETIVHLEMIRQTHDIPSTENLIAQYNVLGAKINVFIRYVNQNWNKI